jgi:hypothetical protein
MVRVPTPTVLLIMDVGDAQILIRRNSLGGVSGLSGDGDRDHTVQKSKTPSFVTLEKSSP